MTKPVGVLLDWATTVLEVAVEQARAHASLAVVGEAPPLPEPALGALARVGGDAFDATVVGLALAADLDPTMEHAFALLHADVRRRRPTADLVARLCCPTAEERASALARLTVDSPLAQRGLLEILGVGGAATILPGRTVVRHVLGLSEPPPELTSACTPALAVPVAGHHPAVTAWADEPSEVLHVHGAASDVLVARVAAALLAAGSRALRVDLAQLDPALAQAVAAECLLREMAAILVVPADGHPALGALLRAIDAVCLVDPACAVVSIAGTGAVRPMASVALPALAVRERASAIAEGLTRHGCGLQNPDTAQAVARRYRFGPDGLEHVASGTAARLRAQRRHTAAAADLLETAAALAGGALSRLATRVQRPVGWSDLAVPQAVADQLRELCARVDVRDTVLDDLGYGKTIASGRGVTALFAGPSGAGKSLAASVVASELGLALYRVDLARTVSKYIGETERNLDAVFAAAESTDVVLLFDEADALFGRRSEVSDAHDRYANLEIAYLLQRMEAFDGVAILSTNLVRNLDDAFTRRLDFRVLFPFPGEDERRRIWRLVWPGPGALCDDVDLDALAAEHELSGGTIRNAALAAAHLAATDDVPVGCRHLAHAVAREQEKLGRVPRLVPEAGA